MFLSEQRWNHNLAIVIYIINITYIYSNRHKRGWGCTHPLAYLMKDKPNLFFFLAFRDNCCLLQLWWQWNKDEIFFSSNLMIFQAKFCTACLLPFQHFSVHDSRKRFVEWTAESVRDVHRFLYEQFRKVLCEHKRLENHPKQGLVC